jgi:hypothetical protein
VTAARASRRRELLAQYGPLDSAAKTTLRSLGEIDADIEEHPDIAKNQLEEIRSIFASWSCMPEDLHQRFHESLPAVR